MKTLKFFLFFLLAIFLFDSCTLFKKKGTGTTTSIATTNKGESEIMTDAIPPDGYAPVYMKSVKPIEELPKNAAWAPSVEEITISKDGKIRFHFNLLDSAGVYYYGGSNKKELWKKIFCNVEETHGDKTVKVGSLKLIELTENVREPIAMAIVMDHSGSMGHFRAKAVQKAALKLIANKKDEDAIALIKYDGKVVTEVALTTNKNELLDNFRQNGLDGFGGYTAVIDGINEGLRQLDNAQGFNRKVLVIFTDGFDNASTISKSTVLDKCLAKKIPVVAIDFGAGISSGFMQSIADDSKGKYYHIYRTSEFDLLFEDIYKRRKNQYILEYAAQSFGKREVTLRLCLDSLTFNFKHIVDYKPTKGESIRLDIYFDPTLFIIKKEYTDQINELATAMKQYPTLKIELQGHTDDKGTDEENQLLSENRSKAVKDALVAQGIDANRIRAVGYGESKPIDTNETNEGRANNRRTEALVLEE